VEANDEEENLFGAKRTLDVIREHRGKPAREIVAQLFLAVRGFCREKAQLDDMTAVVIKVDETC
jgi:serine phosphatase RsbU (regulator of sigma subunit)